MPVDLIVPEVGESIAEVQVARWLKHAGEAVARDENVVVIETDKATVEVPSPVNGVLTQVLLQEGDLARAGQVLATIDETASAGGAPAVVAPAPAAAPTQAPAAPPAPVVAPASSAAVAVATSTPAPGAAPAPPPTSPPRAEAALPPSRRRAQAEGRLRPEAASASRPPEPSSAPAPAGLPRVAVPSTPVPAGLQPPRPAPHRDAADRRDEVVPMTMLRRRVAERLVEAQQNAALLTTFNEVDMSTVMDLRQRHRDAFQEKHGVKLGMMGFFVKAAVEALALVPQVNAEIRDDRIVLHHFCDIGIAVGGGRGLVVPVLRNAERLTLADVERAIADFGRRARDNKLTVDELQGGTFTITNGGIYGSLLSTPIINPPQSGILGMHAIQDRPVARDGQVVIRPMMYIALTYDHRLVDGREAVTFLKRIKDCVEDPSRLLLEV